jgi:hypothetical protein
VDALQNKNKDFMMVNTWLFLRNIILRFRLQMACGGLSRWVHSVILNFSGFFEVNYADYLGDANDQ